MSVINSSKIDDCLLVCCKLEQSIKEALYIPEDRLNGDFRNALLSVREQQQKQIARIEQRLQMLKEG